MKRTQWTEPGVSTALCWIALDSQKSDSAEKVSLPPGLYSESIAPFLHFDTPLPNQLYALGGRNQEQGPLDTIEMFDTWHGQWVTCPRMSVRRAGCSAAALPNGKIMVIGGYDEHGIVEGVLSTCETFDPATKSWSAKVQPLQRARWGHGCACQGGLVHVVGGCSLQPGAPADDSFMETLRGCEVYDPEADSWSVSSDLNMPRAGSRVVSLGEHYLAAVGGCDDVFGRAEMLPSVELFDTLTGLWTILSEKLSTPRTTAAVAAVDDQRILVIGGAPSLSSAEFYHVSRQLEGDPQDTPPTEQLQSKGSAVGVSDMEDRRTGCQAVSLELPAVGETYPQCTRQCVLVVGGESGDDDWDYDQSSVRQFSSVLVFDVEEGVWRENNAFPSMPTPRTAMALCVGPGRIQGHR